MLAQKIVSKAEGREVALASVVSSAAAEELAALTLKDPRLVELVLQESVEVVRAVPHILIVRHRLGFVMAQAGIDASNVDGSGTVLLLPADPDASAERLCQALKARTGADVGVVINDSWGRAWRIGTVGTAIGVAGLPAVLDLRGKPDLNGRILRVTEVGHADEIAAAASLLMGQADEGRPVVILRGLGRAAPAGRARDLVRPVKQDLFR